MRKALFIEIILVIILGIAFYSFNKTKKVETSIVSKQDERVYDKGGEILVYYTPAPEMLIEEKIVNGTKLNILGKKNDFYHVAYDIKGESKEGYIPSWYLDDNGVKITSCNYEYLVLKENTKGLLYPDGPEIVDLGQGRLLKPFLESDDWVQVSIIVYDIPAVSSAWIKKDSLVSTDKAEAREGFLSSDAELYFVEKFKDIQKSKPEKEPYPKSVAIIKRENGYAYVSAAGGWNAWVEEKWISYKK